MNRSSAQDQPVNQRTKGRGFSRAFRVMANIERQVEALADLSRPELVERWRATYRSDPPKGISRRLMQAAIAYAIQQKRYGGLTSATVRKFRKVDSGPVEGSVKLAPGARLVREWNGVPHVVDVVEDGFLWGGQHYRSLSAVARAITGARWSGPRFFAMRSGNGS